MAAAYNITTLTVRPGTLDTALSRLGEWAAETRLAGELTGAFYSEIGRLNRILLIHSYAGPGGMAADRDIVFDSPQPYGLGDALVDFAMDAYSPFPFARPLPPGDYGPYFEVRAYKLRPDGLKPTLEAWSKVLDARCEISPLFTVAYARSGSMPRFVQIWPYRSIDDRVALRKQAVAAGIWPPAGGARHIEEMESSIYLAAAFSPTR